METEKTLTTDLSSKNQDIKSFFSTDSSFIFALKKTEKLASAVYLVTNLFPDGEPMKWSLREKVSGLLSFIVLYKDIPESGVSDFANSLRTRVLELISMLEVANIGGLVSNMNFSILKTEFMNLVEVFDIKNIHSKDVTHGLIPDNFFRSTGAGNNEAVSRGYSESLGVTRTNLSFSPLRDTAESNKDEFRRSNRQNIIINLLKKRKELTIKDIALIIKDCSEKTIQRELISLISSSVIKRTGERRWSRYSLLS